MIAGNFLTTVSTDDLSISMSTYAEITTVKALKPNLNIEYYIWNQGYVDPDNKPVTSITSAPIKYKITSTVPSETIYTNSDNNNNGFFIVYK